MIKLSLCSASMFMLTMLAGGCEGIAPEDGVRHSASLLVEQMKVIANDAARDDNFGVALSMDEDTLIVGAYRNNNHALNEGAAYIMVRESTGWHQQAKLTAPDAGAYDYFGYAVAVHGDTAVVGAYLHNGVRTNGGAAYVFVRKNAQWSLDAKLRAGDSHAGQFFGSAVAVHGDTIAIGAHGDSANGPMSGAVYVFVRSGDEWRQQDKIMALDPEPHQMFGRSVAVHGDTTVVGAEGDSMGGASSGAAYVFVRNYGIWIEQDKLKASDTLADHRFGFSVALHEDALVVGAPYDNEAGLGAGAAYVYQRERWAWHEHTKLVHSRTGGQEAFGWHVAIDGNVVVVGAPMDNGGATRSGTAQAYLLHNNLTWVPQATLSASDGKSFDFFGAAVAVSNGRAVVGSPHDDHAGVQSGAAYVFNVPYERQNRAPRAHAGPDQILSCVAAGHTRSVTLDGSGSSDPDQDPITHRWLMNGQEIAKGASPVIQLGSGFHVILLVVSDGELESAPDDVYILIDEC